MPCENIIYLGDTANMPYGPRTREDITRLAVQNAEFLLARDVKAILVACGTVSSNALDKLRESFDVPFFGVIDSAAIAAAEATETGRVAVIATEASIRSGAYRCALEAQGKNLKIFETACPSFVPLVESGHFAAEDPSVRSAVEAELSALKRFGADTVILGCTHFPLLGDAIAEYLGEDVHLISCGGEAALALREYLHEEEKLNADEGMGFRQWFTSGDAAVFSAGAGTFLGHSVEAEKAEF